MDWEQIARLLAAALGAIEGVIRDVRDDNAELRRQRAADALTAIGAIVETVKNGDIEKLDPGTAQAELERLVHALSENDAAADAALGDKFDTTDQE